MESAEITIQYALPSEEIAEQLRTLSGLEFLSKIAAGELPPAAIASTMGFRLAEVSEGRAVFVGTPSDRVYNPLGVVHGGFALTLIDSATGCAAQTTLPVGTGYGTVETKGNLTRPIFADTGPLTCEGKVVSAGGRIITTEARVTGEDGKLYAHGTSTCMTFPMR
jgi:uncharacterized protein (TIGR00369 family)